MDYEFQTCRVTVLMSPGYHVRHTVEVKEPSHFLMDRIAVALGGTLVEYELVADHVVPA